MWSGRLVQTTDYMMDLMNSWSWVVFILWKDYSGVVVAEWHVEETDKYRVCSGFDNFISGAAIDSI